jgi:hypothetical protein
MLSLSSSETDGSGSSTDGCYCNPVFNLLLELLLSCAQCRTTGFGFDNFLKNYIDASKVGSF